MLSVVIGSAIDLPATLKLQGYITAAVINVYSFENVDL